MRELPVEVFKPLEKSRTTLLHQSGTPILMTGEPLTQEVIAAVRAAGVETVYVPDPGEDLDDLRRSLMLAPVSVSDIHPGETLEKSVYDTRGQLLLEAGSVIPGTFAKSLSRRGIEHIYFRKPEEQTRAGEGRQLRQAVQKIIARERKRFDTDTLSKIEFKTAKPEEMKEARVAAAIDTAETLEVKPEGPPVSEKMRRIDRLQMQSPEEKEAFSDLYGDALRRTQTLFTQLAGGNKVDGLAVRHVAQQTVAGLVRNRDLLLAAGQMTLPDEYLVSHSVGVAVTAVNIGATMGYSEEQTLVIGMGALLHDVGMLRVPKDVYEKPDRLSPPEWREIRRHPSHGLDMLQRIGSLPQEVPFIVYQSHERVNGSGYPRGKKDTVIHTFAKIIAVADTYNSICSDRPYRKRRTPYEAMEECVILCGKRILDSEVMRSFLRCNSMFPVGSWVQLSDGSTARIVAANPDSYMQPTVSIMKDKGGRKLTKPLRMDLTKKTRITVAKALADDDVGVFGDMDGF